MQGQNAAKASGNKYVETAVMAVAVGYLGLGLWDRFAEKHKHLAKAITKDDIDEAIGKHERRYHAEGHKEGRGR